MTTAERPPMTENDPARVILDTVTGTWRAQALYAGVALRLPDHVADGHRNSADLAAKADADPDAIIRLMRLLSAIGVFGGDDHAGYELTPVSQLLRSDVPGSMRDMCLLYGEGFHRAWGSTVTAVRTGRSGFEDAFGRTLHEYLADEPGAGSKFLRAMNAGSVIFSDVPKVFDFSGCRTVTDLAGGSGTLLSTVLQAHPSLRGVLFDREHIVPIAEEHLASTLERDRYDVMSGDFFESVPAGSDVYLLSRILQDWDDSACITLLSNVRQAMTSDSARLLVLERVIPEDGSSVLPLLFDMHLLMMVGGRQRTLAGYESVLDGAGLRLESVHEMPLETTLLVAAPAGTELHERHDTGRPHGSRADRRRGRVRPDRVDSSLRPEKCQGQDQIIRIGIIGLGPRGLSVLERLCANAAACVPPGTNLLVSVVDPHAGNGSRVWRDDQDPVLLMNTVTSQISMFVDDSVDCAGPTLAGPSLYEWARFLTLVGVPAGLPEMVLREAAQLGPDSYPSRSFYGHYLNWTLSHVLRTAPPNVTVQLHTDSAMDLRDAVDGSQVIRLTGGGTTGQLDAVVLTQGHLPAQPSRSEAGLSRFADEHGLRYIRPGNPADVALDAIGPDEVTVLRGMGLSFFDYMALLTIGRGGSFSRHADGTLMYRRCGTEPRLVAGSRRGVPHQARGENQKGPSGRHSPLFFTAEVIGELRGRGERGQPINFRCDVWPLIDREVRAVYYSTLMRDRGCSCEATAFLHNFAAVSEKDNIRATADPFVTAPSVAEERLLSDWDIAENERWDWHRIDRPYTGLNLRTTAHFRAWLRTYLDNDVVEARLGNVRGALKAALDVLRDVRNEIRLVVDHGGLSGDSYRDDLQRWYMPLNAYLSIGPPARRIEEMGALIDAGVVSVMGPELVVVEDRRAGRFVASSAMLPDERVEATALIEARLPETDLRHTTDPLVRNLLARGESRLHRIPILSGGSYPTGGLAVTQRPYRMLDANGHPHTRRFAFGVPTETVHWITAAGIRPGVNSVTLSDADAVARAGIAAALDRVNAIAAAS
jgi:hypothetical protein